MKKRTMLTEPLVWNTDTALRVTSLTARLRGYAGIGEGTGELDISGLWDNAPPFVIDAHYRALAGEKVRFEAVVSGSRLAFEIEPLIDPRGSAAGVTGRATELAYLAVADGCPQRSAVLVVGLDDVAAIVDRRGRVFCDLVLAAAADRLERHARSSDRVTRIGADRFALWINEIPNCDAALDAAHKILRAFDEPLLVSGAAIHLSASVGVATSRPEDPNSEAALLAAAFQEMREVRRNGGNGIKLATTWQVPSSPVPLHYATRESA
jgi:diguanylate cyclase (GGDEF)-like protein